MKRSWLLLLIACASSGCAGLPSAYYADTNAGYVVDAQTNRPIPHANVVYQWLLQGGIEGHTFDLFHVEEAVTDDGGRYQIPSWGPIPRPSEGVLGDSDPEIFVFKSGYMPEILENESPIPGVRPNIKPRQDRLKEAARNSNWNGQTIRLKPLTGEARKYAPEMRTPIFTGTFYLFVNHGSCWWKQTPMLVKALDAEIKRQHMAGAAPAQSLTLDARLAQWQCKPFDDFLRRYQEAK
jgi:hypothetical protein